METQVTITPTVGRDGMINFKITAEQFDEIKRALIAFNKRREVNRTQAAKRRGTKDPVACKPTMVFSYPVAESIPISQYKPPTIADIYCDYPGRMDIIHP